ARADDGAVATAYQAADAGADTQYSGVQPDPDIKSILTFELDRPIAASAIGAGFGAHLGKPIHWFGRRDAGAPWQLLATDAPGAFVEVIATPLLADRHGAASKAQLEGFQRLALDVAGGVGAGVSG